MKNPWMNAMSAFSEVENLVIKGKVVSMVVAPPMEIAEVLSLIFG